MNIDIKTLTVERMCRLIHELLLYIENIFTKHGLCKVIVFSVGIVHCIYASVFFAAGYQLMGLVNIGSIGWYCYAFYLAKNKKNRQAFMATVLEVYFHAVLASSFFGGGSLFILPLFGIYMLQFIAFKNVFTNICIIVLSIVALIVSFAHGPTVYINSDTLYFFIVMNSIIVSVFISFFGIIFSFQGDSIEEIRKKYYIDWLTGLNNRKYVEERMFSNIEECKNLTICICDIDNFKNINDKYGHDVGDVVLKRVAELLKREACSFDCEVARWGGEEFIFKIANANALISQNFFENVRHSVEEKYIQEIKSNITITLGVCYVKSPDPMLINKYFKASDNLLYKGKNSGKNKAVFSVYKDGIDA